MAGMGFNKRRMERERAAAQRAEDDQRRRELGRDEAQAQKLVAVWNSRAARKARPSFYPTIETALLAGRRGWPTNAQPVSSSGTLTFCL